MGEIAELPLFPLGTVLFPNQALPLHVFEERYKLMIGDCLRGDRIFGVVLIKQGTEVGAQAIPFEVGTTARIVGMQPLGQGRMEVQTLGQQPFRIRQVLQTTPYLRATVELLSHERGDDEGLKGLAGRVREHFVAHLGILATLTDREAPKFEVELDPERLSYIVASAMAVEMPEKQRLLEVAAADERLRAEMTILTRENRALQTFLYLRDQAKKEPPQQDSPAWRISKN